jgi:hypothetical protein
MMPFIISYGIYQLLVKLVFGENGQLALEMLTILLHY